MENEDGRTARNKVPPANGATFEDYSRTLEAIEKHLLRLKAMTSRYPIFLMVGGQSYRFEKPSEVDEFVELLRAEVRKYGASRAAG